MGRPDTITMSMRELDRCKVIQAVADDGLMVWRAAEKLGISKRQVERLGYVIARMGHRDCARVNGANQVTTNCRPASNPACVA